MVGVSVNIIELAQGMSENFYAMNNTTDDEARDFYRGEYELYKQRYTSELSRIKNRQKRETANEHA